MRASRRLTLLAVGAVLAAGACQPRPGAGAVAGTVCAPGVSTGDRIYSMEEVDRVAEPRKSNPQPAFPPNFGGPNGAAFVSEEHAKALGEVDILFVVDATGCTDPARYRVISSTDSLFTQAVLDVLPRLLYRPAEKNGQSVRSWLRWKFLFYRQQGARPPM